MSRSGGGHPTPGHRPDVEGMRAVAVLLVLLYHAGVPWLPGGFSGVDVFFVISGYLITGLLLREATRTGRVDLARFWARRARRLLPASALVLLTTAALTLAWVPQVRWREIGWDVVASGLYVVNWRLADRSVDYLAEDSVASPVQHYWSLAVEEQFYVLWPLLVLLALWVARRRGWRVVRTVAVLLTVLVVLPSFVWAVHLSATSPPQAYFVTTTRLWQLGAGALVALGAVWWHRVPVRLATGLAWVGPVAVLAGGVLLGAGTAWPGWATLVPTLGVAAMLVGGVRASARFGPARLYAWPVVQWTGALSYSLYLWHWPVLVLVEARFGELGVWAGLGVVALAVVPAVLGYLLVEQPVRYARGRLSAPRAALALGLACTVVAATAGGLLVREVDRQVRANQVAGSSAQGAGALRGDAASTGAPPSGTADASVGRRAGAELGAADDGPGSEAAEEGQRHTPVATGTEGAPPPQLDDLVLDAASITPDPLEAIQDVPPLYDDGCDSTGEEVVRCTYGEADGGLHVAVVGDSKIAQWVGALDLVGREQGWRLDLYYRSACPWSTTLVHFDDPTRAQACREWGDQVGEELREDPPDVVLTSSVKSQGVGEDGELSGEALAAGMAQRWRTLGEEGVPVVALADTVQPGDTQVYACVADHRDGLDRCRIDYNEGSGTGPLLRAVAQVPTSTFVTMNDWVCPGQDRCPPVVGGVLVYRQGSHITDTYARSLAPVLEARLLAAFEDLGVGAPRGAGGQR
ncbi:acyltransferase 3 [Serinicoccus hydrothermalis]|uniref:Acyltransferase 3 n=1 Tax=Serinicoccus hydrothermalis TaxID=1758689 RepID=A0A1B1N9P4_9MICO|nr:acyltransferase family protein [Serinicoccus hydrothermalis]ANS78146.1 acyltransferase 3 [Serinicoccus hydrothermalis]